MENFPIPILNSVYNTVEAARAFVRERRKDGVLHCRLREASETLNEILKLAKEENPNWYNLYDGMIGCYVQLKSEIKSIKAENKNLRDELKKIREKYMDVISQTSIQPLTKED